MALIEASIASITTADIVFIYSLLHSLRILLCRFAVYIGLVISAIWPLLLVEFS